MKKEEIKLGVEKGKIVLDEYNAEWERIYKVDNGHDNYGFDYINVTSTTKSQGSTE